ncbi:hypothetical protein HDU76_002700 [Blyttiomyces sp. JEL0837]|nr:hypothetical protein HDU76_002700 [Blyttiomyces sp. JEL0837]
MPSQKRRHPKQRQTSAQDSLSFQSTSSSDTRYNDSRLEQSTDQYNQIENEQPHSDRVIDIEGDDDGDGDTLDYRYEDKSDDSKNDLDRYADKSNNDNDKDNDRNTTTNNKPEPSAPIRKPEPTTFELAQMAIEAENKHQIYLQSRKQMEQAFRYQIQQHVQNSKIQFPPYTKGLIDSYFSQHVSWIGATEPLAVIEGFQFVVDKMLRLIVYDSVILKAFWLGDSVEEGILAYIEFEMELLNDEDGERTNVIRSL